MNCISSKRFFTITGNVLPGYTTIAACQEAVEAFAALLDAPKVQKEGNTGTGSREGNTGAGSRAELTRLHTDDFKIARRIVSNTPAATDLKRRLDRATREGTQLAVALCGDYAEFHQRWPFVGVYRANGSLDNSQVRAVIARGIYGRGFTFPEYVALFVDHFSEACRERFATKQALREELAGLWQDAIENTNYPPKTQQNAANHPKRDMQQQRIGKGWRAGEHQKTTERVYAVLENYRAGAQAIIQIGALAADLDISRRTVSHTLVGTGATVS